MDWKKKWALFTFWPVIVLAIFMIMTFINGLLSQYHYYHVPQSYIYIVTKHFPFSQYGQIFYMKKEKSKSSKMLIVKYKYKELATIEILSKQSNDSILIPKGNYIEDILNIGFKLAVLKEQEQNGFIEMNKVDLYIKKKKEYDTIIENWLNTPIYRTGDIIYIEDKNKRFKLEPL